MGGSGFQNLLLPLNVSFFFSVMKGKCFTAYSLFLIHFQVTVLLLNVKTEVYFRILRPSLFNYSPKSVSYSVIL